MKNLNWLKIGKIVGISIFIFALLCLFTGVAVGVVKVLAWGIVQPQGAAYGGLLLVGVFVVSLLGLGWLFTITGVTLGGYLVYRTKRDPYDPFIRTGLEKGQAFNLEDPASELEDQVLNGLGFGVPGGEPDKGQPTKAANNAFLDQMSSKLVDAANSMAVKKKRNDADA